MNLESEKIYLCQFWPTQTYNHSKVKPKCALTEFISGMKNYVPSSIEGTPASTPTKVRNRQPVSQLSQVKGIVFQKEFGHTYIDK